MSLQQRLAKLEQAQTGDEGAGVLGVRRIHHRTQTGADVVTIPATGEMLTEAAFHERYPRGLLILRMEYTDIAPGDEVA
jgi:hypothetical protein